MSEIKLKSQSNTPKTVDNTFNKLLETYEAQNKAKESEKPFLSVNDNEVSVIGDANDTETVSQDYEITFIFRDSELEEIPEDAKVQGNVVAITREYKDVHISPRNFQKVSAYALEMQPFYIAIEKLYEKYEGQELNEEDRTEFTMMMYQIYAEMKDEVIDAGYNLIASLLKIDDELAEHMEAFSVFNAITLFSLTNPDLMNYASVLFGQS